MDMADVGRGTRYIRRSSTGGMVTGYAMVMTSGPVEMQFNV
jgi:hypothetical protein